MHGQGNYSVQVGQDPYSRSPAFQQHPATTPPSTSHYGPLDPQRQVIQHGLASFPSRPGGATYHGGMSSAQSYMHHPRPPHMSNQVSHSYPTLEQQPLAWSQNVHQLPPRAPLQGQRAYQLPSSHEHSLEKGPSHQYPAHTPLPGLPPLPPYTSSSTVLMSDPAGSSANPVQERSYRQSMAPVLPPPPPLPHSSPRVPPSSDILSKKEGNLSWEGQPRDADDLSLECPLPGKPMDFSSVHEKVRFQHTESGIAVGSVDADAAHSLTDSDMDMEDDITYPDEEKNNCVSANSKDECGSMSREHTGEKLPPLQNAGGSILANLLSAEASTAKANGGGSGVVSDSNFPVTVKVGMTGNEQNGNFLDANIKESPSRYKHFGRSGEPCVHPETGCAELPDQLIEGATPLKILQGYSSSNSTCESEDENFEVFGLPPINDVSTQSDAEKGSNLGHKSVSESNMQLLPESLSGSPRNMAEANKLATPTGMINESSDRNHRGQNPVSSGTDIVHQSKYSSRNYDESIGLKEANALDPDVKSDILKVDEFGRLVREDASDSDTSNSPTYARRHGRKARKRSRSQSRSRSPRDRRRRRRRSPWRRKERRDRSRSLSPRRRSRSRSPVSRRDTEFGGDKLRREKGQLPVCFDFLRGKCYRGANCRYSHHVSDKSERLRYNRGKQHHWDAPPTLQGSDIHDESKDKGRRLSEDMPGLMEAKDAKRLPDNSTSQPPEKLDNLSAFHVHEAPSGNHNYLIPESAPKYSDKITQVFVQGKRTDDRLLSESSSVVQALAGKPTRHPADEHEPKQDPSSQLYSVESHSAKPCSNQEVSSQSLKELLPLIANHSPHLSIPLPSSSQLVSSSFTQPMLQDYSLNPPILQNQLNPDHHLTYEASVAYQNSHFRGTLKSSSSFLLPPPPPLPPPPSVEHNIPPQHFQQSLQPPWNGLPSYTPIRNQQTEMPNRSQISDYQAYPFTREPDQMLHRTDGFGSSSFRSNLTSCEGGPSIMGKDHLLGDPVQGMYFSKSLSQPQTNPLFGQSPFQGMHSSLGAGLSSDSNSFLGPSNFQQASHGLQYSTGGDVRAKHTEPGAVISSASRTTLERSNPYVHGFIGSKVSNYFNPYVPTFDLPLSSSNASVQEINATITTTYGTPVDSSSIPVDPKRIGSAGSENIVSSNSVLPVECVSRPGGSQYDPLFDSIEPPSKSFSKADPLKLETTGDSDDVLRFHESGRLINTEVVKQEEETTVSSNDSLEKEECGETTDVVVGAVLNSIPSDPNDASDMNAGEFEIDQLKTSGKKKKSKERLMKHFKISIAAFVKEVLKPSWKQGNMSKEAFKTIVKKTVDKVSGAMKSHQVPKSQAKINHYIDSSRGKLTKLVMGHVDKYVNV